MSIFASQCLNIIEGIYQELRREEKPNQEQVIAKMQSLEIVSVWDGLCNIAAQYDKNPDQPFTYLGYNSDFIDCFQQYLSKYPEILHHLPGGDTTDISKLCQTLKKILRRNYEQWKKQTDLNHNFSFFVVVNDSSGIIGPIYAQNNTDTKNTPPYHITGGNISPNIQKICKNCFDLVQYDLLTRLNLPSSVVEKALKTAVVEWQTSLINDFHFEGESYSFCLFALLYICALRSLQTQGIIQIIDIKTQRKLDIGEIQLPMDILMTGSFNFEQIPDIQTMASRQNCFWLSWKKRNMAEAINAKPVEQAVNKIKAALHVNEVFPTFQNMILPLGSKLDNNETLNQDRTYSIEGESIQLIAVKDHLELLGTLAPLKKYQDNKRKQIANFQICCPIIKKSLVYKIIACLVFLVIILGGWFHWYNSLPPVELQMYLHPNMTYIPSESKVDSNIQFKLKLIVRKTHWIYVCSKDAAGNIEPLFPSPDPIKYKDNPEVWFEFKNPCPSKLIGGYWIPPKKVLNFDETKGIEKFIIIYASKALPKEKMTKIIDKIRFLQKGINYVNEDDHTILLYNYEKV